MKILKLHIDQFRHLENLNFDFTYQTGERKGQPLDKICFIGQSATGKTGLLELIYEHIINALNIEIINGNSLAGFKSSLKRLNGEIQFLFNDNLFIYKGEEVFYNNRKYEFNYGGGSVTNLISTTDKKNTLYFKANLISDENLKSISTHPNDLYEKNKEYLDSLNTASLETIFPEQNYYLFDNDIDEKIWLKILNEYIIYLKNFTQKMSDLIHKGLLSDTKRLEKEYKLWEKENPKKLLDLAEKLNPILIKIGLEIDKVDTSFSIPIRNIRKDELIQINDISTGTKQLLLTSLPLYELNTKDSIILIDEPERSLYPDMQMDIMEHYKNLAPEAQFIIATHSPFVAASFEADERFILYFDEEGKVAVRRGSSPIGDDPNDMLKNDFGLEFLMNKEGLKAFERFKTLKKSLASEKDDEEKDKLLSEILVLAKAYKF